MPPKVFISYSHDSNDHKDWVRRFAEDLRAHGIDATLDQWDLRPGQDIVTFMHKGISEASRVLMICSASYVEKAENGSGGVGYEQLIVTSELVENISTAKFVPIIRNFPGIARAPRFIGSRLYLDFRSDESYNEKFESLVREIFDVPAYAKPPLRDKPDFSPNGFVQATMKQDDRQNADFLNDKWFEDRSIYARAAIQKLAFPGFAEIRAGLSRPLAKKQTELLTACRNSQIQTFGWPIGVMLEGRREFAPRAKIDGIEVEISPELGDMFGRNTFDYWYVRNSGDFIQTASLFEDYRGHFKIFFDTRIVRTTEAVLYVTKLYKELGASGTDRVHMQLYHQGLAGRQLVSASANRMMRDLEPSHENACTTAASWAVEETSTELTKTVITLLSPLFALFEFMEFSEGVYDDIVRKFESGRIG